MAQSQDLWHAQPFPTHDHERARALMDEHPKWREVMADMHGSIGDLAHDCLEHAGVTDGKYYEDGAAAVSFPINKDTELHYLLEPVIYTRATSDTPWPGTTPVHKVTTKLTDTLIRLRRKVASVSAQNQQAYVSMLEGIMESLTDMEDEVLPDASAKAVASP